MGILTKIRQKSDRQKNFISLIGAVILTLVIVIPWFSFLTDSKGKDEFEKSGSKLSEISPLQVIREDVSNAFSEFSNKFSDLKEVSSSTESVEIVDIDFLSTSTATVTSTTDVIIQEII